ncbi:MAG: lamin tail domain-containing protein [Alphaproteobacteria bacterium]|nr:lamin tail domain-containing protein [Alphaproteobacteria bacterium]
MTFPRRLMVALGGLLIPASALAADPPGDPGDLLVTEVMTEPQKVPNYYGQWFELYNNSGRLIDLNGVVIRDAEGEEITITGETLMAPEAYLVLGVSDDTSLNGNVDIDIVYNFNDFHVDKTGDELLVYYNNDLIDEVRWTSAWGLSPIRSLQLAPQGYLEWANGLNINWCDSDAYIAPLGLYGTPGTANDYCSQAGQDNDQDGWTEQQGDCDDSDAFVNPSTVDGDADPFGSANDDADCDGVRDNGVIDDDNDGYTEVEGDCNDANANVNPSRNESRTLDGIDNDCNCYIDDVDTDGDSWPDLSSADYDRGIYETLSDAEIEQLGICDDESIADCDDTTNQVYPGATEIPYDGVDNDCDGSDECDVDEDNYVAEECGGVDCDDSDPDTHPGAPDALVAADGKDNDCDGTIDSPDRDDDGYGIADGDCDDEDPEVNPGVAVDLCDDTLDNNCDGFYNEGCDFPAVSAGVRGGGLFCGVAPGTGAGGLALAGVLMLLTARRRR